MLAWILARLVWIGIVTALVVIVLISALIWPRWSISSAATTQQNPPAAQAAPAPTATAVPTATVPPTAAPAASTTPVPAATAVSTPAPQPTSVPTGSSFNPYPFYSQSCGPEKNSLGGCVWDIGTMGSLTLPSGQNATQVGIVKGASITWGNKVANSSSNGRCALVVLSPNGWFENLTVKDANVTVYNVATSDIAGWVKTLVVQNAYEQHADYGCPVKSYDQVEQWGSPIASPPCGTPGFNNCGPGQKQQSVATPATQSNTQASPPPTNPSPSSGGSSDTVDGKPRKATADTGGSTTFQQGDAVYGYRITVNGNTYNNCWFASAPGNGTVVDGVVHPWKAEVTKAQRCNQ